MYRSLLVPLDGSAFAEQALPLALTIAQKAGASLQVARVAPHLPDLLAQAAKTGAAQSMPWLTYLDALVVRLKSFSPIEVTPHLLEGDPVAPTLCEHVERTGVDLLVASTHGRGALGRFWVGSVAYELMYALPVPILLLRPEGEKTGWTAGVAPRRMLLPLDGSDLAEQMLEPAAALCLLLDMSCTLLRVVSDLPVTTASMDAISLSVPTPTMLHQFHEVQERQHREAEEYLERMAERLRGRGLRVQTRVVVGSDPATHILEAAADADFIGIESHGRRGLSRLVLGSVARKVIHGSPVPVLFHSATGHKRQG